MNKDIFYYGLTFTVAKGLQFSMLPLLTSLFSIEEYGLIDFMSTLMGLATILISLSLESALARMWHEKGDNDQKKILLTSVTIFVTAFGFVILFAVCITSMSIDKIYNLGLVFPVAIATAFLLSIATVPQMALRMERNVFKFGMIQIANTVIGIFLSLILIIHYRTGLIGLFVGNLIAALFVVGLSIYWTRDYLQLRLSRSDIVECLKYSLPLVPATFLTWVNSQADRFILLGLLGIGAVGVYGAAAKVAMIIAMFVEVFRLAWIPIALRHISQTSRNIFIRKSLIAFLAIMIAIGLVFIAYSKELLALLTTSEYIGGYVVIPWLVGAQIFVGSASITNVGIMISKKTSNNIYSAALGAITNILMSFILVEFIGIRGAAIGSFFAAIIFTAMLMWFSLRYVDIAFDRLHAFAIFIIFTVSSTGILWAYDSLTIDSIVARTVILLVTLITVSGISIVSMRKAERHSA